MAYGWEFGYLDDQDEVLPLVSAIGPHEDAEKLRFEVLAFSVFQTLDLEDEELADAVTSAQSEDELSPALSGVLDAVDTAVTVLVEHGYYDLDGRSEEAFAITRQYRFAQVAHNRLHFFDREVALATFVGAMTDPQVREELQGAYLGYCVLRSGNVASVVGRTLVAPPKSLSELKAPGEFVLKVRTRVREDVTLAGIPLSVEGVPFMQQDGAMTRCAHAAGWMVHYTAVLRGLVPRTPVANLFQPANPSARLYNRQYPSPGLTSGQLDMLLVNAGLPPEITPLKDLAVYDRDLWIHRDELNEEPEVHWKREAFTTEIGRYLNSGVPTILALGNHVLVVCGYLRQSHFAGQTGSRVSHLVVSDDSLGPYILKDVDDLLRDAVADDLMMVPLPPLIALSGRTAEYLGAVTLRRSIEDVLTGARADGLVGIETAAVELLKKLRKRQLAARSFVIESNEFKASLFRRCQDESVNQLVAPSRLPKYVWVVEIIERARRGEDGQPAAEGTGPVLGEIVLDGCAPAENHDRVDALIVHLPAYVQVYDPQTYAGAWAECGTGSYESGRWAHGASAAGATRLNPRLAKSVGVYR